MRNESDEPRREASDRFNWRRILPHSKDLSPEKLEEGVVYNPFTLLRRQHQCSQYLPTMSLIASYSPNCLSESVGHGQPRPPLVSYDRRRNRRRKQKLRPPLQNPFKDEAVRRIICSASEFPVDTKPQNAYDPSYITNT